LPSRDDHLLIAGVLAKRRGVDDILLPIATSTNPAVSFPLFLNASALL